MNKTGIMGNNNIHIRKQLAAIASFRILFDKQKDSYEVLRCFIGNTIAKYSMRLFTVAELLTRLEEDFSFGNLPVFVVEKALRPLTTTHTKAGYTCDELPQDEPELDKDLQRSDENVAGVLNLLYAYVEGVRKRALTEPEKQKLEEDFSDFLLTNRVEDDNAVLISSFVLENGGNQAVQATLNEMREGMILYSGLSFTSTKDASEKWKHRLNVYLDTELLFHATGLNGELKKKLFDDFKRLVDEINEDSQQKKGHQLINLKCFNYVGKEVEKVFNNARDIIEGRAKLGPNRTAQELLTKGVKDSGELVMKRVVFDEEIKQMGVEMDDETEGYYTTSTYWLNIEDPILIEELQKDLPSDWKNTEKRVMDSLQSLSYVNVRRKTYQTKDFEQCRSILLTENNTTKRISQFPKLKKPGIVPLCTDLYYFTNRLWAKLGKGFGSVATPSIFTAANKARIIISSKLDMIVAEEYDKLCAAYDEGKLTDDQASSYLHKLKTMAKRPEEVESTDIVDLNLSVNGNLLESYMQEQELKEAQHRKERKKYEEQARLMSKYEEQEAKRDFEKALLVYKKTRNHAYKTAKIKAIVTVALMLLLVVIAIVLGALLKKAGESTLIALLSGSIPLLTGGIWFLAKLKSVSTSFLVCFSRIARGKLKRSVLTSVVADIKRPSYIGTLALIKKRNGSK